MDRIEQVFCSRQPILAELRVDVKFHGMLCSCAAGRCPSTTWLAGALESNQGSRGWQRQTGPNLRIGGREAVPQYIVRIASQEKCGIMTAIFCRLAH